MLIHQQHKQGKMAQVGTCITHELWSVLLQDRKPTASVQSQSENVCCVPQFLKLKLCSDQPQHKVMYTLSGKS